MRRAHGHGSSTGEWRRWLRLWIPKPGPIHQCGALPADQKNMHENVQLLKELGFKRILSSGFRPSAAAGADFLAQMIAKHHRDLIIMPGAGIKVPNLEEILTTTRCREFHASAMDTASEDYVAPTTTRMECDVTMGKQDIDPYYGTNPNVVRKMVTIASAMSC
ncbi:copper homeostasis protein cutC homolog isoform X2 [Drosophila ananassae]|uniref:copper homeostasis protein cutC homolog isoform X2 n=1 Tax=Drosophila ananassae TaxID=7217 RepID=UPI001D0001E8|nr:copper homeostasis protein cutC homolog isoform X2 [Drosophila ananassae]